jgi:preprotein translocase subunit SecE
VESESNKVDKVMANAKIETVTLLRDRVLALCALAAVIAGLAGFYLLGEYPLIVRVLVVIAGLLVGGGIGSLSEPGKRFFQFTRESVKEARLVVWPSGRETMQMTGLVIAFVFLMALFMWLTDKSLELVIYDLLLGWKR